MALHLSSFRQNLQTLSLLVPNEGASSPLDPGLNMANGKGFFKMKQVG
jgi:hypothetical protein